MAIKRVRLKPRTKSMISAPPRVQRLALFGPPLLLEGEDEAAYNELLAQFCGAIVARSNCIRIFGRTKPKLPIFSMAEHRMGVSDHRTGSDHEIFEAIEIAGAEVRR
jgi:hypothetical protein